MKAHRSFTRKRATPGQVPHARRLAGALCLAWSWGLVPVTAQSSEEAASVSSETPAAEAPAEESASSLEAVGSPEWQAFMEETIEEIRARTMDEQMNEETAGRIEDGMRALDQIAQGVARFSEALGASFQSEEFKAFSKRMEEDFKAASEAFEDVDWHGLESMVRAMAEEVMAPLGIVAENLEKHYGGGERVTESREVSPFHAIEVSGSVTLDIALGPETRVEVAARETAHQLIRTEVKSGTLHIAPSQSGILRGPITVAVTTPTLERLIAGGANHIRLEGLEVPRLEAKITGATQVVAAGRSDVFHATLSGAAHLDAGGLTADSVDISCAGACQARVHAVESLRASVTGASTIIYTGDPAHVRTEIHGVGSVRKD